MNTGLWFFVSMIAFLRNEISSEFYAASMWPRLYSICKEHFWLVFTIRGQPIWNKADSEEGDKEIFFDTAEKEIISEKQT